MLIDTIFFLLGFIFLIKGADLLVDGSSSIAKKYGISNFVIGLTIVAFGTSMPELLVSTLASFKGSAGVALGNIIGSNISNTLLILGISAVIRPLLVKKNTVNKEIPFSLLAVLAVGFLVNDKIIDGFQSSILTRIDGFVLILFLGISSVIAPIPFSTILNVDFFILFAVTILLLFLIFVGKRNILGRVEGSFLIFLYNIYHISGIRQGKY